MAAEPQTLGELEATGPDLVVITGMAGAGKTLALHTFEDAGYFCIDNLPPSLLHNLVSLAGLNAGERRRRLAVVCDLRSQEFFTNLKGELARVRELQVSLCILFLDAQDTALLKRYKETRRRHPLCEGNMTLEEGIAREREELSEVREMANYVIDSTNIDARALRREVRQLFVGSTETSGLRVAVFSFGFKHGYPHDGDILIDVRFLPNPFYEEALRPLTGLDEPVHTYVLEAPQTREFLLRWQELLATLMPGYVHEGKRYLSIGVGCTGGQHRSVVLAEQTAAYLREQGYHVSVAHHDLGRAQNSVANEALREAANEPANRNESWSEA